MSKVSNEKLRGQYIDFLKEWLKTRDEEILQTNSNEIAIPVVDENGDDQYVVFCVKIPSGSRDGEAYDGHSMAQDYTLRVANKAETNAKNAKKKEAKIKRDAQMRADKAAAKLQRLSK